MDGVPPYNIQTVTDTLTEMFEDKLIPNNGTYCWPVRLHDFGFLYFRLYK